MKLFFIFKILLVIALLINHSNGARILSIFGYPGPSQYIIASALLKGLTEKGHEVTSISTFPQRQPIRNFRDIAVMENSNLFEALLSKIAEEGSRDDFFVQFRKYSEKAAQMATNVLENSQVKEIMKNEKFDLLLLDIFMSEALFGLGEHFKAHIIGVSTMGTMNFIDYAIGNVSPPSYIPHMSLPIGTSMSLKQRMWNFLTNAFDELLYNYVLAPKQEKIYRKYFPSASLSFAKARKNVSLVLLNQHFSLSYPRPYVPNMIEVGGLHIKQKPDPLPDDLQQFLDNATEGVIYFSMGSNLKSKDFPGETLAIFLEAFRELKVKVLWKFENETLANKPENVAIKAWLPQQSVLAHPNVKLFISHGGFLSTTEAIFHGKPILGLPIYADQPMNVQNAVKAGYAVSLKLDKLTKDDLKAAINELLTNDRYSKTIQKLSNRFRDQPQTPLERAIYWIEYVLRHEGAAHMHNAGTDLNYWQLHSIDVIVLLIGGFIFVTSVLIFILRFLSKIFCSKKIKKTSPKTKRS